VPKPPKPQPKNDPESEDEEAEAPPPPKSKTKRRAKPEPPPVAETAGDPEEDSAPQEEEAEAAPPPKPKTGTARKARPEGTKARAGGGGRAPRGGPPPEPPKRGAIDYLLAAVGPIACAGVGVLAFLVLQKSMGRAATNSIVAAEYPGVDVGKEVLAKLTTFTGFLPPWALWAPIALGAIMGILGSVCLLVMTPGLGSRMMGIGCILPGCLLPLVFFLEGLKVEEWVEGQIAARYYKHVRHAKIDPRVLDLKGVTDFPIRRYRSLWKLDLDEGEIPMAWLTVVDDVGPDAAKDTSLPEKERALRSADLRAALHDCRELMKDEKLKPELEPELKKLEELRDKILDPLSTTYETERKEVQMLEDNWAKFMRKTETEKAFGKPEPQKEWGWFKSFKTFGDAGIGLGNTKGDRALVTRVYLGKAVHAAYPPPYLPAEMRYAAAYYALVDENYVGKDDKDKALTKNDYVFVCYDIEHMDNPPVLLPQVSCILDEARLQLEVLAK